MSDTENAAAETSELEKAIAILNPLFEKDATDEEMVVELIKSGFKFAKAGKLLAKALEHKGKRVSAKDRYAAASEILVKGNFAPTKWKEVEDVVAHLCQEIQPTTEGQAFSCIKRFAKEHKLILPSKPAQRLRNDFQDRFYAWALENRDCTDAQLRDFIVASNAKENQIDRYVAQFGFVLKVARAFAA